MTKSNLGEGIYSPSLREVKAETQSGTWLGNYGLNSACQFHAELVFLYNPVPSVQGMVLPMVGLVLLCQLAIETTPSLDMLIGQSDLGSPSWDLFLRWP